jgi:hypothetical protein
MRNLVKEYIESGKSFDDLKNEYAISVNEFDNLICLTYDQIESPKSPNIVRQCRGIVLDKNTLEIVHYPFFRFFNLDEMPEERLKFNWNNAFGLQKIDGCLFGAFNYNNVWYITTRSQIGGMNFASNGMLTFSNIFDMAIKDAREDFFAKLNPELDYTFELVSPYNKIVTPYPEPALYIIGVRDKANDFKEMNISEIYNSLPEYIRHPELFSIKDPHGDFIGFEQMKALANGLENPTDEGFVVVDYSSYNDEFGYYPRIKVKNNSYVALHHLRGANETSGLSYGSILEIVWNNEQDEVISNLPALQPFFDEVMIKFANFDEAFSNDYTKLCDAGFFKMSMEERVIPKNKKNFAMAVKDSKFKNFFFNMWLKDRTFKEDVENNCSIHFKYFKKMWEDYVSKF